MARRRIGQERLRLGDEAVRRTGLDDLAAALDWEPLELLLRDVYAAAKGEPAWPPLALFKALLLAQWHDLSDVALAEALDDRASFRRFCGFAASEPVPERTAFVRFRRELARRRLDGRLFGAVVRQLDAARLTVRTGTLVDATIIPAADKVDGEARWMTHPKKGSVLGYKAHVATDESGGIVRRVMVTPANVHDSRGLEPVLGRHPGRVWADAGYDSRRVSEAIRRRGGQPRIVRRLHGRASEAANAKKKAWNETIHPVRGRIEKVFGTVKRSYGMARARYRGLRRVRVQVHLGFIAYNLKRAAALFKAMPA